MKSKKSPTSAVKEFDSPTMASRPSIGEMMAVIPKSVQVSLGVLLLQRARRKEVLSATGATFGFLCLYDAFQTTSDGKDFIPGFVGGCVAAAVEPRCSGEM